MDVQAVNCKRCYDKGYASVMTGVEHNCIDGMNIIHTVHPVFCFCDKGKWLRKALEKWIINLEDGVPIPGVMELVESLAKDYGKRL